MKTLIFLILTFLTIFTSCELASSSPKKVAILMPLSHPSLEKIKDGFIQTIRKKDSSIEFVIYNANGTKSLMRSEIEEIIRKKFDLVLTIGTLSSQMVSTVFSQKSVAIPHLFTCVHDPIEAGIIEANNEKAVTGISELLNFEEELTYLLKYKPSTQKILLVYNPSEPGLEKNKTEIKSILKPQNIELLTVEIFHVNELIAKVPSLIERSDAVLILKDNTVISGLDFIVKLANRAQIPVMTSDLDSPDKGAAFGYGVYEIEFGIEAAKKALSILDEGMKPFEIPVTPVSAFTLRINREAALQQGIEPLLLEADL